MIFVVFFLTTIPRWHWPTAEAVQIWIQFWIYWESLDLLHLLHHEFALRIWIRGLASKNRPYSHQNLLPPKSYLRRFVYQPVPSSSCEGGRPFRLVKYCRHSPCQHRDAGQQAPAGRRHWPRQQLSHQSRVWRLKISSLISLRWDY